MTVWQVQPFRQTIAVTGGIGSGKSLVSRWLATECNFPRYDADKEVSVLLNPGEKGWNRLRIWLSPEYFDVDGRLLKGKLRQAIFIDEALRHMLEHDLHPLVLAKLQAKISGGEQPCLVEVPLLYEVQWQNYFDCVIVVYAEELVCRDRVMSRDGMSEQQAMAAIRAQMPIGQKSLLADYIVDNNRSWPDTLLQLEELKKKLPHKYLKKKIDSHVG